MVALLGQSLIDGGWTEGEGDFFSSHDSADGSRVWAGNAASQKQVVQAVGAASAAFQAWRATAVEDRVETLRQFASNIKTRSRELATLISQEVGKPLWESATEVNAVAGKIGASIEAFEERAAIASRAVGNAQSVTRFRPHGVVAVIGPFNFPAHMANGHIVPALLAGNAVVLKPSELSPAVSEVVATIWQESGIPSGVFSLLQGGREVGQELISDVRIGGVFFTGSRTSGVAINQMLAGRPEVVVALEMGGNSPIVVWDYDDERAAILAVIQSAYITAGQRCSSARRLIVRDEIADSFLAALAGAIEKIKVGNYTDIPEPFMGPVIDSAHAERVLRFQEAMLAQGGTSLVPCRQGTQSARHISPGLLDVSSISNRSDEEVFGPLLQVIRVSSFDEAVRVCNDTAYGLAAGLISVDPMKFEMFLREVDAGIVNWNQQLTGASGLAPFGGLKASGNHRPSGYFAVDYCSHAIGSMEADSLALPASLPSGIEL